MKTALIAIDVQNDFMDIANAALPVPNAVKDTERLCKFIGNVHLDTVISSLDSHLPLDISHPAWWNDFKGN